MAGTELSLLPLVERLGSRVHLTQADRDAVSGLPHSLRSLRAGELFVREGDKPTHCGLMLSGIALRHKLVGDGKRQILGIHLKGDMVDLQNAVLTCADHNVEALTDAQVAAIPRDALEDLAFAHPSVGKALWFETLVDGSIFREWIANVGQRDARQRIAHLLCELGIRFKVAGLAPTTDYEIPLTQDQLADALGLTPVHVNRTLMAMAEDGLIERRRRSLKIGDWQVLAQAGDFQPAYLHLPDTPHSVRA